MFTEALAVKIVKGQKTQTRRRISDNSRSPWRAPAGMAPFRDWTYPVGKVFTVNPGRGVARVAECEVTGRRLGCLGNVGGAEARAEGFATCQDFFEAWAKINGGKLDARERIHVVEFKLAGSDCMGCDGCGWCEGSPAFTCPDCFGTGIEVGAAARALIAKVEAEG